MKKNKPQFEWDEEYGVATCTLHFNNLAFIGQAACHEDDKDMMNKNTGLMLAQERAEINYYKYIRDCELKPAIKTLKELYNSMQTSKKFNPKSYEAKRVYKKIKQLEDELSFIKEIISTKREHLTFIINEKEKFYQKVRANREKDKIN